VKTVTFTRDMKPFRANEDRVLPDDVADQAVAAGDARDPRPFPPADVVFDPREQGQTLKQAPKPARGFLTRRGK